MKAPSEGKPNTTMVILDGACALAGRGGNRAKASAAAQSIERLNMDIRVIESSIDIFLFSLLYSKQPRRQPAIDRGGLGSGQARVGHDPGRFGVADRERHVGC